MQYAHVFYYNIIAAVKNIHVSSIQTNTTLSVYLKCMNCLLHSSHSSSVALFPVGCFS